MDFKTLSKYSYVPYSGNNKVCVVKGMKGSYYSGVKVENLSYPLSIGRIQSALFSCLADGDKPEAIIFPDEPEQGELVDFWIKEYNLNLIVDGTLFFEPKPILISGKLNDQQILGLLEQLCSSAVTPNSNFQVAALLEVEGGYIPGVNIECSSWELGLCAERVAISRYVSLGHRKAGNMYVMAPKSDYVSPCGGCRQVLMEHLPGGRIILQQNDNQSMSVTTSQLLPYHFGGDILKKTELL